MLHSKLAADVIDTLLSLQQAMSSIEYDHGDLSLAIQLLQIWHEHEGQREAELLFVSNQ